MFSKIEFAIVSKLRLINRINFMLSWVLQLRGLVLFVLCGALWLRTVGPYGCALWGLIAANCGALWLRTVGPYGCELWDLMAAHCGALWLRTMGPYDCELWGLMAVHCGALWLRPVGLMAAHCGTFSCFVMFVVFILSSRKHACIILTPLNPTFI